MPDARQVAAYEEALRTIAAATVRCRAGVQGFHVDQHAARDLLTTVEGALSGLIALGAVPTPTPALPGPPGVTDDPEVYLGWCDDGVTLVCERDSCRVGGYWFWTLLPHNLTPEQARDARDAHVRTAHR